MMTSTGRYSYLFLMKITMIKIIKTKQVINIIKSGLDRSAVGVDNPDIVNVGVFVCVKGSHSLQGLLRNFVGAKGLASRNVS